MAQTATINDTNCTRFTYYFSRYGRYCHPHTRYAGRFAAQKSTRLPPHTGVYLRLSQRHPSHAKYGDTVSIQVDTATRQDRKGGCMDDTAYAQQAQAAITDIDRRISGYSAELSQVRQKIKELEEDHNN